jgi:hypothetical protein
MSETYWVSLNVQLPRDIALQAEELQRSHPEFLAQVVLYGLARRSIYHKLRDELAAMADTGTQATGPA